MWKKSDNPDNLPTYSFSKEEISIALSVVATADPDAYGTAKYKSLIYKARAMRDDGKAWITLIN